MKTIEEEYDILKREFQLNFSHREYPELYKYIDLINRLQNDLPKNNIFLGTIKIKRNIISLKRKVLTQFISIIYC